MKLTFKHILTDEEDAHVASMFLVYELSSYDEATMHADFDKRKVIMHDGMQAVHNQEMWNSFDPSTVRPKIIDCS